MKAGNAPGRKLSKLYLIANSVSQALEWMDGRYNDLDKTFGALLTKDTVELVHGKSEHGQITEIGLGGQIWAMMALWPRVKRRSDAQTPRGIASAIGAYATPKLTEAETHQLAALISSRETNLDGFGKLDAEIAKSLHGVVVRAICRRLSDTYVRDTVISIKDAEDAIIETFKKKFSTPEAAARTLLEKLGLTDLLKPPTPPQHHIEPSLLWYFEQFENTAAADKQVAAWHKAIKDKIGDDIPEDRAPVVVISGPEHAGKKAVIGDFLAPYKLSEPGSGFPLTGTDDGIQTRLPVLALSLRARDYRSLACEVLAFLTRLQPPSGETETDIPRLAERLKADHRADGIDGILNAIRAQHAASPPALFIFLDAHELGRDSLSRVLHHSGLFRLIDALAASNTKSRMVLSATDLEKIWPRHVPGPHYVKIGLQRFSRLNWYLSGPSRSQFVSGPTDPKTKLSFLADRDTDGAALMAMAVILHLGHTSSETFCDLVKEHFYTAGARQPPATNRPLFAHLVMNLHDEGVLPAVALVAAAAITSDYLTASTLRFMLEQRTGAPPGTATDEMLKRLRRLADAARGFFVVKGRQGFVDPDELHFRETGNVDEETWSMSEGIARAILQELGDPLAAHEHLKWPKLRRRSLRQVSIAARRRAQLKRLRRAEDASVADRADLARDIQCYIAMLASLPPFAAWNTESPDNPRALRLSLPRIFTVDDTAFDPRLAFQFAVLCILRQDIDPENRLTMVTDQDELRLRLYLLAFCPPGDLQSWRIGDLRTPEAFRKHLPGQVPPHVSVFGPEIVLDLLLTVAMAAYHCVAPHIVAWAWTLANDAFPPDADGRTDEEFEILVRLDCVVADMGILTGTSPLVTARDRGLRAQLAWIAARNEKVVERIGKNPMDPGPTDTRLIKEWMRLAAREAELSWMAIGSSNRSRKLYSRLEELEHHLSEKLVHGEPVILGGKTARRYARFLCGGVPILPDRRPSRSAPDRKTDVTDKVRHVIEANISRLNRYSGADRIGTLVDLASLQVVLGNPQEAKHYIDAAMHRLGSSGISAAGRLDVELVQAACVLRTAETDGQDQFARTNRAQIDSILSDAKVMGLVTAQCYAALLHLRFAKIDGTSQSELLVLGEDARTLCDGIGFAYAKVVLRNILKGGP